MEDNTNGNINGRMGSAYLGDLGFKDKYNGNYGDITIDNGAFHSYTTTKLCTIRMSSGVNLSKDQTILEGGKYEKEKHLAHEGLAQRYILEGGSPIGVKNRAGSLVQAQAKGFPGTYHKGKTRTLGFAYGDPMSRGDAKDGFGIVPMPGITGCNIRTKSAYGSLREASIDFVCYNQRQLEILELLYMRPGYTVLLEWGWTPYISNKGKITNNFPYVGTFFDPNATHEFIDRSILENKIKSGGNYDAILGICKNFEYKLRTDGGYDCTTELIARGEVLEGLKFKLETVENSEGEPVAKTQMELVCEKIVNYGEFNDEANDNIFQGGILEAVASSGFGKWAGMDSYESQFNAVNMGLMALSGMDASNFGKDLYPYVFAKDSGLKSVDKNNKSTGENKENSGNEFNASFVKWEFLAACINNYVVPRAVKSNVKGDKNVKLPLFEIMTHGVSGKYVGGERVVPLKYAKIDSPLEKIMPKIGNATIDYLSIDMSADPSICLLPHQIVDIGKSSFNSGKIFKTIAKGALWCVGQSDAIGPTGDWWDYDVPEGEDERHIGNIYLNAEHLLNICKEMGYDGQGKPNKDFGLMPFLERVWGDVNTATGGTHDFKINVDHEKNNQIRVVDMIFDQNQLEVDLDKIVKINIQSPDSIVRDVAYNTSIPSALSATIAVAAQAPSSVDDLESVTWAALNKNIYNRFTSNANEAPSSPTELDQARWRDKMNKDLDIIKKNCGIKEGGGAGNYMDGNLPAWRTDILQGEGHETNEDGGAVESELINEKLGMMKSAQSAMERVYLKYGTTNKEKNIYYGMVKPTPTKPRSAIIPLKFNAKMDGIGGIVIGNVFKLPKDRLPRGYDSDDVSFIVMGEEQDISGNDWTTTINGHLILLGDSDISQYAEGNWDSNQYDESKGESYSKGSNIDLEQSIIDPDMNSVGIGDYVYLKVNDSYSNFRTSPGVNNEVDITDLYIDNNIGMFDKNMGGLKLGKVLKTHMQSRTTDGAWSAAGFRQGLLKDFAKGSGQQFSEAEVDEEYQQDGTKLTAEEKLDPDLDYAKEENAIVYKTSTKRYYAKIKLDEYNKLTEAQKSECIIKTPLGELIGIESAIWRPMTPDTVGNMASIWFLVELTQEALDHFNVGWVMNLDGTKMKDGEEVNKWRIDVDGADGVGGYRSGIWNNHNTYNWQSSTPDADGTDSVVKWAKWIKNDSKVPWYDEKISARGFLRGGKMNKKDKNFDFKGPVLIQGGLKKGTITGWIRIDAVQASAEFTIDDVFEKNGRELDLKKP